MSQAAQRFIKLILFMVMKFWIDRVTNFFKAFGHMVIAESLDDFR